MIKDTETQQVETLDSFDRKEAKKDKLRKKIPAWSSTQSSEAMNLRRVIAMVNTEYIPPRVFSMKNSVSLLVLFGALFSVLLFDLTRERSTSIVSQNEQEDDFYKISYACLGFSDSLFKQLFIKQRLLTNVSDTRLSYVDKRTDEKLFDNSLKILQMLAEMKEGTLLPFVSSNDGISILNSLVQGTRLALNLTLELRKVTQPMDFFALAPIAGWVTNSKAFANQLLVLQDGFKEADNQRAATLASYIQVGLAIMICIVITISIFQLKLYVSVHDVKNQIYNIHAWVDGRVLKEWMTERTKKSESGFGIQSKAKAKKDISARRGSHLNRADIVASRKLRSITNIPLPKARIAVWSLLLLLSFSVYATMMYYGLSLSKSVSDNYGNLIQHNANILIGYVGLDYLALGLVFFEVTGLEISTGNLTNLTQFLQSINEIRILEDELENALYSESSDITEISNFRI
jgi:hypothetical protein